MIVQKDHEEDRARMKATKFAPLVLIALVGLAACGGGTATNPNPQATVNFNGGGEIHLMQWTHFVPQADVKFKQLTDRWASQHSGWKVVVDIVASNDLQTKASASVLASAGPDIIQMEYNWPLALRQRLH